MKILLINPPAINTINEYSENSIDHKDYGAFPPLGLLYIAAYLRKHNLGHEIIIYDADAKNATYNDVGGFIKTIAPALVGITTFSNSLLDVLEIVKRVKEINAQTHVCLGGHHAIFYPRESVKLPGIDSIVYGEGEIPFSELVNKIETKGVIEHVAGLFTAKNISQLDKNAKYFIKDIDSLPFPARDLLPVKDYYNIIGKENSMATILTSRGCPFSCTFCNSWRNYRVRSIPNTIDEIKECLGIGLKEIFFYDDTFNLNPERVIELCNEIKRQNLEFKWSFRGRCNPVSEKMLLAVKGAGCFSMQIGVETGSNEGLAYLKKGVTIEQIKNTFKLAKKIGIRTVAYFMIGLPFEKTSDDVMRNIDFLIGLDPDYASFSIFNPRPYSAIYETGIKKGLYQDDWQKFAENPKHKFQVHFWEEYFNHNELLGLQKKCYRRFYLRPKYILKNLLSTKSMFELRSKFKGASMILKWSKKKT